MNNWTTEDVYASPPRPRMPDPTPDQINTYPELFTEKFLNALKSDRGAWDPRPSLTPEEERAVGLELIPCPICNGRREYTLYCRGISTGWSVRRTIECLCLPLLSFWSQWKLMPLRWTDVTLEGLEPSAKSLLSLSRQADIITTVKASPESSYILAGDSATGKTHIAAALYRAALQRWSLNPKRIEGRAIFWVKTTELLDASSRAKQDPNARTPHVTPAMIYRLGEKGVRPALFFDEIDKVPATESKLSYLHLLVDAVTETGGQLVATSNLGRNELVQKWGSQYALPITRRFFADSAVVGSLDFRLNQEVSK